MNENQFEVVRVNCGIASISLFRVNIPLFSKSIWFGTEIIWAELDNKIKLQEVLKLPSLFVGQYSGSRKALKIFIIHNNVNGKDWTIKIVVPNFEGFKNGQEFLVINVVV